MSLNLASTVLESARRHAGQPALGAGITYSSLSFSIIAFAQRLSEKGIQAGDRVAVMSENRPEFTVAYFAVLAIGAIVVPVNTLLSRREVSFCLSHAGVKGVVYSQLVSAALSQSVADLDTAPVLLELDSAINVVATETNPGKTQAFDVYPTSPDDTAVIFYTSGTTGQPKGAAVTHFNLHANAQWVSEWSVGSKVTNRHWGPGHCALAVLSLSHSFGQTCMQNAPLMGGACISYMARFEAAALVSQLVRDRVTLLAAVPRMIRELMALPPESAQGLSFFQYCLVGGAPIDQPTVVAFEDRFSVSVLEGYGLSETSPVIAFRTPDLPRKKGSVGRAIRGVVIRIVDDGGRTLPLGEIGELAVKGEPVMKGYFRDSEATGLAIKEGWFYTGDLGYLDADGDVFLVDRKNDVIIRNGYNVYPAEVEKVLTDFPGVVEIAVVGIDDTECGQEIKAFVVGQVDVDLLKRFARDHLAAYKYPRIIELVASLPKGSKGQVLRRELRKS
ncbi:MAG: AMP-binding protein [bacterium]|nr:AMP-binding protein [bacterium]